MKTTLVEGIGNEVLIGFAALLGVLVPALAYVLNRFVFSQAKINEHGCVRYLRPINLSLVWFHFMVACKGRCLSQLMKH